MEVPAHFDAREYQAKYLSEVRKYWFVVMEWARRAGKGLTTFVYAASRMTEETMGVVIIYPTAEQGYRSFWNNIENDGFRTIEHIPPELRAKFTDTKDNMSMVLKNGSTLDLLGANADPEKLRGNNVKLYILSEFVDMDSGVLDIIEPIVIANGGQIIVESTPKQDGISGMTFIKLRKAAEKNPDQYASMIYATEYMDRVQLARARQACINRYGNDFKFRQEYLLDEGQALETSYYGNILTAKEKAGLIGNHPYNPEYPVFSSWDLGGGGDSTAGVFWQYHNKKLNIIDAYETHVVNDALLVKFINSRPYAGNYRWHFFPHDGTKRDSDGVKRIVKLQKLGLPNASIITRRGSKRDALDDVIELVSKPTVSFHLPTTGRDNGLLEKMRLYKRKWNPDTGDYMGPEHNSASHYSDAVQYMSDAIKEFFHPDTGRFLINTEVSEGVAAYISSDEVSWDF